MLLANLCAPALEHLPLAQVSATQRLTTRQLGATRSTRPSPPPPPAAKWPPPAHRPHNTAASRDGITATTTQIQLVPEPASGPLLAPDSATTTPLGPDHPGGDHPWCDRRDLSHAVWISPAAGWPWRCPALDCISRTTRRSPTALPSATGNNLHRQRQRPAARRRSVRFPCHPQLDSFPWPRQPRIRPQVRADNFSTSVRPRCRFAHDLAWPAPP